MRGALSFLLCFLTVSALYATDGEAITKANEALAAESAGKFRDAAQLYEEADFLADETQLKVNALKSAVMCYRKADLLEKEFESIERLLNRHPGQTKYDKLVERQYEIARLYYDGKRDPAFWALRGVPWLKGPDMTVDMLKKVLKRAPFSPSAPAARLLLALKYDELRKPKDAVVELRKIIKDYPGSPECKFAYVALGDMLFIMSRAGDGDGSYNREATAVFQEFKTKYPDAGEKEFIDKRLLQSKDIQAERLLGIAGYYKRLGRDEAAARYLNTVLAEYPDTAAAEKSEAILVTLDKTKVPDGFRPEIEPRISAYDRYNIPAEESELIIVPENSNGRFLLPVYDLSNKQAPEKNKEKASDETDI